MNITRPKSGRPPSDGSRGNLPLYQELQRAAWRKGDRQPNPSARMTRCPRKNAILPPIFRGGLSAHHGAPRALDGLVADGLLVAGGRAPGNFRVGAPSTRNFAMFDVILRDMRRRAAARRTVCLAEARRRAP